MQYGYVGTGGHKDGFTYGLLQDVTKSHNQWSYSPVNLIQPDIFNCCGLASMYSFGRQTFIDFNQKAEYLAGLHRLLPKHILYAITDRQESTAQEHLLFLEIGAEKVAEFPNLTHGPALIQLWVVSTKDAIGIYLDIAGTALVEKPEVSSPAKPVAKKAVARKTKPKEPNEPIVH